MKRNINRILFWLLIIIVPQAQAVNIKKDQEAIIMLGGELSNIRGMLELYAKLGISSTYKISKPKNELKEKLRGLDDILSSLETKYNTDKVILSSVNRAKSAWKPVKKVIEEVAIKKLDKNEIKSKTKFIHDNIRGTLKEIEKMKNYLTEKSGTKYAQELNAIIEIGASARRISAHYMMKILEVDDPTIEEHYKKGLSIYRKSLKILYESSLAIDKDQLKELTKKMEFFEYAWNSNRPTPILISKWAFGVYMGAKKLQENILKQGI